MNRRAFLRAGGVAIALPFLEGLPSRSAWAADNAPVFSLYIVAACGVVGKKFFPDQTGALTTAGLAAMTDKATHVLAPHASNLLFIRGINFPMNGPTNCGHAQGLCQALTARPAQGGGKTASATGVSADVVIAELVNEGGAEPLTLYAGNRRNGYIAERISFKGGGAGQVRPADDNPYALYAKLVGLADSGGGSGSGNGAQLAEELLRSRKSANDFVKEELNSLMRMSALSSADKHRLQQHFDSIRDTEVTMGEMGGACSQAGLATSELEALKGGLAFKTDGMIEDVAKLHLELVALAFACNFNRVATLQHGDGTDQTKYAVPSNASLGWPFHHLSHRVQSDASSGNNPTAEQAHAEIDVLRMQTLLHGLDQFKARDLFDKSIIMWTNHVADGPSHSFRNVPTIIAGNGGGYLKQGQYIDAGNVTNNRLFNGLIAAAVRDKTEWTENFGEGQGSGPIDGMLA
ncbi:hypothetical protein BE04_35135 [Sorangium cellulosum]|uniref:Uncharacterized protein n=2 Tax=Sorangium cellulosum TaxID=56 RepID=A0A150PA05_SORCE|nr:DUF1552 domain-containing protein [Sorangium cellulosum]AGP39066.1 hypothetical protein SCE1572_34030 [Sorangium cellulosum So0157-2]KYF52421.1 hypothetical protein BE04_35135 [Sorangium cellulosum]